MTRVALGQTETWDQTTQNIRINLAVLRVIEADHAKRGLYVRRPLFSTGDMS
jgi:hypothetical protein